MKYIFGIMDILYVADVLSTGLLAYGARVVRPVKKVVVKPKTNAALLALVKKLAGTNPKELVDTLASVGLTTKGTFETIANIATAIPVSSDEEKVDEAEEMPDLDVCSCDECLGNHLSSED